MNIVNKTDLFSKPRIDDCVNKLEMSNINKDFLFQGIWQIPLAQGADDSLPFATLDGLA